jgi:predicted dehydrogenase
MAARQGAGNGNGNGNGKTKANREALLRRAQLKPERTRARIALVGCGYWGPKVIRAAASLPEVEIAALVDRELSLAEGVQRHFPAARIESSLSDVLTDETIDAVIIATPPETHFELAAEALAAGKHALVEKPLALTADDCRTLGAQALDAGLILMVGHTFRFSPAVQHVRQLIAQHELGEVYYIDSQRLNLGRVRQDVDAIWNFAPHDISIIQEWFGRKPVAVNCHAYDYLQQGIPDLGFLVLEYEFAVAHIQVSWLSPNKVRRMTVVGSRKMVVYDDVASSVVIHDAGIDREHLGRTFSDFNSFGEFRLIQRSGDLHVPRLPNVEPLAAQCRHFIDCIFTGNEPSTNFQEAADVVEILEAANVSREQGGGRVELDVAAGVV